MDKDEKRQASNRYNSIEDMFTHRESILMCQRCGKIRYQGGWYEHPSHPEYEQYIYTLCPEDYTTFLKEIKGRNEGFKFKNQVDKK